MNTIEAAKLTGIGPDLLVRMRARETRTLKGGPPHCKIQGKDGEPLYVYDKKQVMAWMKTRRCQVTAADAALILEMNREELLKVYGLTSFEVKRKGFRGRLIVNNSANIYIWLPLKQRLFRK